MNPMKVVLFVACLAATVFASPTQKQGRSMRGAGMKPSDWISASELVQLPALDKVTIKKLESMSAWEGGQLLNRIHHLSQIQHSMTPSFVPSASSIPCYILKANGKNISVSLNGLASAAREEQKQCNNGSEELTILVTGLSDESSTVKKANRKLVSAYMQRYNTELTQQLKQEAKKLRVQYKKDNNYDSYDDNYDDDYENSADLKNGHRRTEECAKTGTLMIIDLGKNLDDLARIAKLDTEETGEMIGQVIVDIKRKSNYHNVHLIGQGIAAHVVGAASRKFTKEIGEKVRRATGLDPSKIFAKTHKTVPGLARGDADFVDAIHTSAYGMGTSARAGDIDFFPNGPSVAVPGTDNVIEAVMRATAYYAETVVPGNEHNFPAVPARSLEAFETNNGYGKRTYMGVAADYDLEGDYIVKVNNKAPYGKAQPAGRQVYQLNQQEQQNSWGKSNSRDY